MAEKLAEATWASFAKKRTLDLDDGVLLKALARCDKADAAKPDLHLAALEEVVEQVKKLVTALTKRKKELGDKPFNEAKDKLYGLLDAAEATHTLVRSAAEALQKSARNAAAKADDDDDEDSPALLTTKMLPLLRELQKGEVRMHALVCTAGKNTALLIMRRPIGTPRRKMLSEAVDAQGGAKFVVGECLYEANALTFVVQAKAAGLAKRLRQALLDQAGLRLKVRVHGEDGDAEDEGEDELEGQQATDSAAPQPGPSAAEVAYNDLLARIGPLLEAALKARHAESTKLRAVSGFASEKAAALDFDGAAKALEMIERLLGSAAAGAGTAAAGAAGDKSAQMEAALEAWRSVRNDAVGKLRALSKEIAEAKLPEAKEAIIEVSAVFKQLTAEPRTLQQVQELRRWLEQDDVVDDVCTIEEDDIRTPLLDALLGVQRAIETA